MNKQTYCTFLKLQYCTCRKNAFVHYTSKNGRRCKARNTLDRFLFNIHFRFV